MTISSQFSIAMRRARGGWDWFLFHEASWTMPIASGHEASKERARWMAKRAIAVALGKPTDAGAFPGWKRDY